MKLQGREFKGPNVEIIAIPRSDGDVILKAQCILDWDEFEKVCPEPIAPTILHRGTNVAVPNFEDPGYAKNLQEYRRAQTEWMILKSLQATEGLEWETVNMSDPTTYSNFRSELSKAGFTTWQIAQIINGVMIANGLDERKIEEAKKRFLATTQAQ